AELPLTPLALAHKPACGSGRKPMLHRSATLRTFLIAAGGVLQGFRRCGLVPGVLALLGAAFAHDVFAVNFAPTTGAGNVCTDAPLSVTFNAPPSIGTSGKITVFRDDGTIVDTIDLADPNSSRRQIGGATSGGSPIN